MFNHSVKQLDSVLAEALQSLVESTEATIQRTLQGPVTPSSLTSFNLKKFKSDKEYWALAIFSWYLGTYGVLLREDLETCCKCNNFRNQEVLWILLSSKENMLSYLSTYHERTFFGTWLPRIKQTAQKLRFLTLYPKRAKRTVRHRGYRDHGSCRPESRWLETSDWSFTEKQNELEKERSLREQVHFSILKFGLLGVRLPELEM